MQCDSKKKLDFDKEMGKIFSGFRSKFKKFFKFEAGYSKNTEAIAQDEKYVRGLSFLKKNLNLESNSKNLFFWTSIVCFNRLYSVFRLGEIQKKGNHKGLPLQEMYLTQKEML